MSEGAPSCLMHDACRQQIGDMLAQLKGEILSNWRREGDQILAELRAVAQRFEDSPTIQTLAGFTVLLDAMQKSLDRLQPQAIAGRQTADHALKIAEETRERVDSFEQHVGAELENLRKAVSKLEKTVRNGAGRSK